MITYDHGKKRSTWIPPERYQRDALDSYDILRKCMFWAGWYFTEAERFARRLR